MLSYGRYAFTTLKTIILRYSIMLLKAMTLLRALRFLSLPLLFSRFLILVICSSLLLRSYKLHFLLNYLFSDAFTITSCTTITTSSFFTITSSTLLFPPPLPLSFLPPHPHPLYLQPSFLPPPPPSTST